LINHVYIPANGDIPTIFLARQWKEFPSLVEGDTQVLWVNLVGEMGTLIEGPCPIVGMDGISIVL